MVLSNELVSQFAKVTVYTGNKTRSDQTVYGTIVEYDGSKYMKIDGSDLLTPMRSTTNVAVGERVVGTIKNHALLVTGNMSSPAARTEEVETVGARVSEFNAIVAYQIKTEDLQACYADIENLKAKVAVFDDVEAVNADIENLVAKFAELESINANDAEIINADIEKLKVKIAEIKDISAEDLEAINADINSLTAKVADFDYVSAEKISAVNADINDLRTNKLSTEDANIKYANIDFSNIGKAAMEYFYAQSGLIRDVTVGDQTITGHLVGVTISGDLIEGNTIKADKLVIKGSDGLYYKLNTDGVSTSTEQTDYNSLNGSIIRAKSITATQISVKDLVAFDATIGGFNITGNSLYSGVKSSVENTTRGIYMDNDGQMALGDAYNYVKYYKDTDGSYKLAISASTITFGGSSTLEEAVTEQVQSSIKGSNLLGQNLILNTSDEWCYKRIDIGVVFHIPIKELVDEYELTDGDQLIYSVYLKSTGTKNLASGWLLTNGNYNLADFNKSLVVEAGSEGRVVCSDIILDTTYTYLALAVLNSDYETQSSKLFIANVADAKSDVTEAYRCMKLEKGVEVTDWSLAPKDWENRINANTTSANNAQSSADNALNIANSAMLQIDNINGVLGTLVTGKNGETLMTQTDKGWTFNIANIQDTLGSLSGSVSDLNVDSEQTQHKIESLKQSISDLGVYTEYIKFIVYNGQPCIVLGEEDSDFKVMITNTDIRFMEGSIVVASISNQALNIEKAVVKDELSQGDFAWVARANGHYSLMWKG